MKPFDPYHVSLLALTVIVAAHPHPDAAAARLLAVAEDMKAHPEKDPEEFSAPSAVFGHPDAAMRPPVFSLDSPPAGPPDGSPAPDRFIDGHPVAMEFRGGHPVPVKFRADAPAPAPAAPGVTIHHEPHGAPGFTGQPESAED